jgi:hypothetical protein
LYRTEWVDSSTVAANIQRIVALCGDGFMDFIHHPKSKILKILKIKITTFQKLALLPSSGSLLYTIVKTFRIYLTVALFTFVTRSMSDEEAESNL